MKIKIIQTFFIFCSALFFSSAFAQQKIFTEEDLLAAIEKFHPVAKQAALEVEMAKAQLTAKRGAFDPLLSGTYGDKTFEGINYYNKSLNELKIPTWYGIELYAGNEYITGSKIDPENTKGNVSYFGVSVPLLQNLVTDKRRTALQQAKIYTQQSAAQRREIINDLLLDALTAYSNWWQQHQQLQLVHASLQNAQKRMSMIRTYHVLGDRPAIDTLEAFTQVQLFTAKETETTAAFTNAGLELSVFLWSNENAPYQLPADAVPQNKLVAENILLDSLMTAALQHPELQQYQFKLAVQEAEKRLKFQYLLPKVDVKYNQLGNDFKTGLQQAWFDNNYRFGVSFSMPLRLSEARGEYKTSKLKISQTQLAIMNKQVQLQTKLQVYFTEWQQTAKQIETYNSMLTGFTKLLQAEEIRFSNGESSLFLINARELKVLETQQKLIELQAKNKINHVKVRWAAGLLGGN